LYNNDLLSVDSDDCCDLLPNSRFPQLWSKLFPLGKYMFSSLIHDSDVILNIWHLLLDGFSDHSGLLVSLVNVTCTDFVLLAFLNHGYDRGFAIVAKMLLCDCYEVQVQLCRAHRLLLWNPKRPEDQQ